MGLIGQAFDCRANRQPEATASNHGKGDGEPSSPAQSCLLSSIPSGLHISEDGELTASPSDPSE
jgi:hypothetical protein